MAVETTCAENPTEASYISMRYCIDEHDSLIAGAMSIVAEREYAWLMRNMSIEYGLLLLTKLDKLGLN